MAPNGTYSGGNSARASARIASATATLTHHGERSRIANSEFSAIFSFTAHLGQTTTVSF